jgi:hypothetical protein
MALTTKLEAVNIMISVIGESPVNTLSGTSVPVTVTQAVHALDETSKAIQSEGWHFNTEYDYPLVPDSVTSKITLPVNTLKIDLDPELNTDTDAVQRGLKLYDRKNHRDTWTKDLKAIITFELEFEELPEQFRHYISVKSARIFAARFLGSREIEGFALRDEIEAKARAIESDSENADRTIFDHYSVMRVIDR